MKKIFLVLIVLSTFGITQSRDSRWNRFKNHFGFGEQKSVDDMNREDLAYKSEKFLDPEVQEIRAWSDPSRKHGVNRREYKLTGLRKGETPRLEKWQNTLSSTENIIDVEGAKDLTKQGIYIGHKKGRHLGRYEGFRDTALIGAGIGATALAGYGLYRLWHWGKKPLHRFKDDLESAIKNLKQADSRVIAQQSENISDTSYVIDESLKSSIQEAKGKLESILQGVNNTLKSKSQDNK